MADIFWFICVREAYPSALPFAAGMQQRFNRDVVNNLAAVRKSRHGIGDLLARPISASVPNHLLCDGSAVSRVDYPQLFQEIGEAWGVGDGTTTFNIPSLNDAPLPIPAAVPEQVITDGATVSTGEPTTQPTTPAQTGGTTGNTPTGGRPRKFYYQDNFPGSEEDNGGDIP